MDNEGDIERLNKLIRDAMGDRIEPFKAFLIYERGLDRIWVQVRDCSVTEKTSGLLTIMEDNYPEEGQEKYVGFAIECAVEFSKRYGYPLRDKEDIRAMLEGIFDLFPRVRKYRDRLHQMLSEVELVRLPQ